MNLSPDIEIFYPTGRAEWRQWLQQHHNTHLSIWLLYYKKNANKPTISYTHAVDEALCYGWIDSKVKSIDEFSYIQFFCRRKPDSVWSKVNKEKVNQLIDAGLMADAGKAVIEIAKANGSWTILDDAEALITPPDLAAALESYTSATTFFHSLSRTDKRNKLQWIVLAKKAETRARRIAEVAALAQQQRKPSLFS
jgi:uncharacterized protein YdeI (YjbR/CyaY-like superfamily)